MVEQVEISEILNKLICQITADSAAILLSQDIFHATYEEFDPKIWQEFQSLKQPKVLAEAIAVPILRKNSVRVLLYVKKQKPSERDAMRALTWLLNNVELIEHAVKFQLLDNVSKNYDDFRITARPCSPGIAMGRVKLINVLLSYSLSDNLITDVDSEIESLTSATKSVVEEMQAFGSFLANNNLGADLLQAYCNMLDRHGILHDATEFIMLNKCSAGYAVQEVIKDYVKQFQRMSDPYLRSRAIDIKDIGFRIIKALSPNNCSKNDYSGRIILVAEDISPLMIAEVPVSQLAGLICLGGSRYSHASILARALGVPFVIEASELPLLEIKDKVAIVDGYIGSVHLNPPESSRRSLKDSLKYEELLDKTFQDVREQSSETGDGFKVDLNVNVGLGCDIQGALRISADGVGLFRTEVPFMLQNHLPSVSVQSEIYSQILKSFHPKPVSIRSLDIGGDKRLPYINKHESNPYLGTRGFRFSMEFPSVFRMQVEAVLLANVGLGNARLLLPMITSLDEVVFARGVINDLQALHGLDQGISLGIMIEVPGVISVLDAISDYVDFFSVGTNDLTQYILAVDRNNNQVASLYDSWHPAVLKSLHEILELCNAQKKSVSVCGELAGDPMGALMLISMGYRSLSMNHRNLLKVKWLLRQFTLEELSGFWLEVSGNLSNAYKIFAKGMSDRDFGRFVSRK